MPLKQTSLKRLWSGAPQKPAPALPLAAAPPPPYARPSAATIADDDPPAPPADYDIGPAAATDTDTASATPASPLHSFQVNLHPALPSSASIEALAPSNLPAFRRLIKTLLPIRYPDKTFAAICANPLGNHIARVLIWRDPTASPAACSSTTARGTVVAAICARVQPVLSQGPDPTPVGAPQLYVQMLGVLAPWRGMGLAAALLEEAMRTAAGEHGVKEVFAHVWEAHEEALEWYQKRGFTVEEEMVEGYYQRLNPRGARIVRRRIGVKDFL